MVLQLQFRLSYIWRLLIARVGVFGASGRIGRLLVDLLVSQGDLSSIYTRTRVVQIPNVIATSDILEFISACEIVIDFSLPEGTKALADALKKSPRPFVCGVTGLEDIGFLRDLSVHMPVLFDRNMSLGIATLCEIVKFAAKNLTGFDIEILEMHHRFKKDAPSGTALKLFDAMSSVQNNLSYIQRGNSKREAGEVNISSLRGGDVAGRHMVGFYADGEFLELKHEATSPITFAKGAIRAAKWLESRSPGFYSMSDIFYGEQS